MSKCNYESLGISRSRYEELRGFCYQYPEWIAERKRLLSGDLNKSPEASAVRSADLKSKIELVERCAMVSANNDTVVFKYLLKHVTVRYNAYEKLNPPICKNNFYKIRRLFYVEIDKFKK